MAENLDSREVFPTGLPLPPSQAETLQSTKAPASSRSFFDLLKTIEQQEQPRRILTADCSDPKEIDDGIYVEPLASAQEMYRVGVCVADTSKLFPQQGIYRQAMEKTRARYWDLPNGERGYEPMIDPHLIEDLELREGEERSSLVLEFIVGEKEAPRDLSVTFQPVFVEKNLDYRRLSLEGRTGGRYERHVRAAGYIMQHLKYRAGGDQDSVVQTLESSLPPSLEQYRSRSHWFRGSKYNEAYMIAANHLVGKMLADEGSPAIYRVFDPSDEKYLEFIPPNIATYSWQPGPHAGLSLEPICRVTSPLRRLEDFVMNYQLKQRFIGRVATRRDEAEVYVAVQHLNRQLVADIAAGPLRLNAIDVLGAAGVKSGRKTQLTPLDSSIEVA